jgi:hypothetical protein
MPSLGESVARAVAQRPALDLVPAVVSSADPLEVDLRGGTVAALTVDRRPAWTVGDRVWVVLGGGRALVIGGVAEPVAPAPAPPPAPDLDAAPEAVQDAPTTAADAAPEAVQEAPTTAADAAPDPDTPTPTAEAPTAAEAPPTAADAPTLSAGG